MGNFRLLPGARGRGKFPKERVCLAKTAPRRAGTRAARQFRIQDSQDGKTARTPAAILPEPEGSRLYSGRAPPAAGNGSGGDAGHGMPAGWSGREALKRRAGKNIGGRQGIEERAAARGRRPFLREVLRQSQTSGRSRSGCRRSCSSCRSRRRRDGGAGFQSRPQSPWWQSRWTGCPPWLRVPCSGRR